MPGKNFPLAAGGTATLALVQAAAIRQACFGPIVHDMVVGTLQHVPAPIAHLDVDHPFPLPRHPMIPLPGDPGAFATNRALEDR